MPAANEAPQPKETGQQQQCDGVVEIFDALLGRLFKGRQGTVKVRTRANLHQRAVLQRPVHGVQQKLQRAEVLGAGGGDNARQDLVAGEVIGGHHEQSR